MEGMILTALKAVGMDEPLAIILLVIIGFMVWLWRLERKDKYKIVDMYEDEDSGIISRLKAEHKVDTDFLKEQATKATERAHEVHALRSKDSDKLASVLHDVNNTLTILIERLENVRKN